MHLTNYSINKESPDFVFNDSEDSDDVGHKRSLTSVFKILENDGVDCDRLWTQI
jgi:tubulin polyglutamylase TTLL6/13